MWINNNHFRFLVIKHTFAIRLSSSKPDDWISSFQAMIGFFNSFNDEPFKLSIRWSSSRECSTLPGVEESKLTSGWTFGQILISKIPRRNVLERKKHKMILYLSRGRYFSFDYKPICCKNRNSWTSDRSNLTRGN